MAIIKNLSPEDFESLKNAHLKMEHIGWAMKGLNKLGNVFETGIEKLPQQQQKWLHTVSQKVLHTVVKVNLKTMRTGKLNLRPSNSGYKVLVTSSGILGGTLGAAAFAADLTITTKLIMRSIMDIARSEGETLESFDTQLACLQVFALGGKSKDDDGLDTSYYATRVALGTAMKNASAYAVKHGVGQWINGALVGSSNPLLKLLGAIATRFSIQVSEKFVAQAIPILGAAGGGAINLAFMNHFQSMAKAHFTIRRLERKYGEETVRLAYQDLSTAKS